jgi:multidrug transporter EmrE-like cation transporter
MFSYGPLFIIILIVLCETLAISCVKEFHATKQVEYFLYAIIGYSLVCCLLYKSFDNIGMAMTNVIWSGLSILLVTIIGVLYFKEVIHTHDIFAGLLISAGVMIIKMTD